ncbi:MAG: ATP-binding cassette domain-containing protein [Christensenellaceae bacterium]|jgi:ABC-type lipoprotein export system ATPase subunit|nr:ATP-binding cassette domain-containing protein [Christensenellaceae bacterium]
MLEAKNITKTYSGALTVALGGKEPINLSFSERGFVLLLGESGSGKSTLLNVLSGADAATTGEVSYNGVILDTLDKRTEFAGRHCASLYQGVNLVSYLTAYENVLSPLLIDPRRVPHKSFFNEKEKLAAETNLGVLGLLAKKNEFPTTLSGGEKQRVAFARALIKKPQILFADEPTGKLDGANSERIFREIKSYSETGLAIVVTHDIVLAEKYADRIIVIRGGQIVSDRSKNPQYKEFELQNNELLLTSGVALNGAIAKVINENKGCPVAVIDAERFVDTCTVAEPETNLFTFIGGAEEGKREYFISAEESAEFEKTASAMSGEESDPSYCLSPERRQESADESEEIALSDSEFGIAGFGSGFYGKSTPTSAAGKPLSAKTSMFFAVKHLLDSKPQFALSIIASALAIALVGLVLILLFSTPEGSEKRNFASETHSAISVYGSAANAVPSIKLYPSLSDYTVISDETAAAFEEEFGSEHIDLYRLSSMSLPPTLSTGIFEIFGIYELESERDFAAFDMSLMHDFNDVPNVLFPLHLDYNVLAHEIYKEFPSAESAILCEVLKNYADWKENDANLLPYSTDLLSPEIIKEAEGIVFFDGLTTYGQFFERQKRLDEALAFEQYGMSLRRILSTHSFEAPLAMPLTSLSRIYPDNSVLYALSEEFPDAVLQDFLLYIDFNEDHPNTFSDEEAYSYLINTYDPDHYLSTLFGNIHSFKEAFANLERLATQGASFFDEQRLLSLLKSYVPRVFPSTKIEEATTLNQAIDFLFDSKYFRNTSFVTGFSAIKKLFGIKDNFALLALLQSWSEENKTITFKNTFAQATAPDGKHEVMVTDLLMFTVAKNISGYLNTYFGIEIPTEKRELREFLNSGYEGVFAEYFNVGETLIGGSVRISGIIETGYKQKQFDLLWDSGFFADGEMNFSTLAANDENNTFIENVMNVFPMLYSSKGYSETALTDSFLKKVAGFEVCDVRASDSYFLAALETEGRIIYSKYTDSSEAYTEGDERKLAYNDEIIVSEYIYYSVFKKEFDPLGEIRYFDGKKVVGIAVADDTSPYNFMRPAGVIIAPRIWLYEHAEASARIGMRFKLEGKTDSVRLYDFVTDNGLTVVTPLTAVFRTAEPMFDIIQRVAVIILVLTVLMTAAFVVLLVLNYYKKDKTNFAVFRSFGANNSVVIRISLVKVLILGLCSAALSLIILEALFAIFERILILNLIESASEYAFLLESITVFYQTLPPYLIAPLGAFAVAIVTTIISTVSFNTKSVRELLQDK